MTIRIFVTTERGDYEEYKFVEFLRRARIRDAALLRKVYDDEFEITYCFDGRIGKFGPANVVFYNKAQNAVVPFDDSMIQLVDRSSSEGLEEITQNGRISFASLATNLMAYRHLRDDILEERARLLLLAVHDLMALRQYSPGVPEVAKKSLTKRLIRAIDFSPEQVKIYLNGSEILLGDERRSIQSSKPAFYLPFRTRSGRSVDVEFAFGSVGELGKRAAVLIGKNGIGKTHALKQIAAKLLNPTIDWDEPEGDQTFQASRVLGFYSGPRQSKAFPIQSTKRRRSGYKVFNLQEDNRWSGVTIFDAIADLLTSNHHIASTTRFELFRQSIRQARKGQAVSVHHEISGPVDLMRAVLGQGLIRFEDIYGRSVEEDIFEFVLALDSQRGVFSVEPGDFSSGEESYVRFCAYASLHVENSSAVLMDEPEVYLHPQYIDALMGTLHQLLELTGSVAFIATHSAYVVRCAEEHIVYLMREPGDRFSFDRELEFAQPRMKTFGADVGMISLFVFGEDEMETTISRARHFIERQGGSQNAEDALRILGNLTSLDLVSKITNKHD